MRPDAEIIAGRKARRWSGAHVLESRNEHKTVCDELHWCMRALAQTIGALKVTAPQLLALHPDELPAPGLLAQQLGSGVPLIRSRLSVAAAREGGKPTTGERLD